VVGHGGHFLIALVGLVDMAVALSGPFAGASASAASGFRIDGPSSANDTHDVALLIPINLDFKCS
jgi:hypothetical protein